MNAGPDDMIITAGYGMTAVINKLMRILSLKGCGGSGQDSVKKGDRPVVFLTHMEHHSNQTSWLETIADVRIMQADEDGLMDLSHLKELLLSPRDAQITVRIDVGDVTCMQPTIL